MTPQDQPRAGEAGLREALALIPPTEKPIPKGNMATNSVVSDYILELGVWSERQSIRATLQAALSASTAQAEELSDEQIGAMCDVGWIGGASLTRKKGFIAGYRAALSAHPRGDAGAWRPIETAPRDGSHILTYGTSHDDGPVDHETGLTFMGERPTLTISWWSDGGWYSPIMGSQEGLTHWMPIPAPPTPEETPDAT